jgi:hypothetical protein
MSQCVACLLLRMRHLVATGPRAGWIKGDMTDSQGLKVSYVP